MPKRFIVAVGLVIGTTAFAADPVKLTDEPEALTLDNGIVFARIQKRSGDVISLKYKNLELLTSGEGRSFAYWSLPGTPLVFGSKRSYAVRDDPSKNDGVRGTIACKFDYDGGENTSPADVTLIYSLGRGDSALYLQGDWEHKPEYPQLTFGPGRFAAKLNPDVFDYMTIDDKRRRVMPTPEDWAKGQVLNMKEAKRLTTGIYKGEVEHKYDYVATQFDTPAYGWSSTKEHIGLWLITPSNEYMSGGPTKIELNAHLDGNETGWPTLLNVWKGPHYGATQLFAVPGESWTKCIGPFLLYCNSAPSHEQMWKDALDRAATDAKAWPFEWVNDPSFYPPKSARSTVIGQIILSDQYVKQSQISNLLVGLSAPDWKAPGNRNIDWQQDSKFYQFWVRADSSGHFAIPNVRAGDYVLHAFATGVLGELSRADIKVVEGKPLDLGQFTWTPARFGKPIWEIGVPDRTAGEFFRGDDYWHWGLYTLYPKDFPNDVNFAIGKSDWKKDWNLMQVPRGTDPDGKGQGTATTWTIRFDLPSAPRGRATLRLALAGTEARSLAITMNDQPAGSLSGFPNTMVIHRDSNRSYWTEKPVSFDASLMKAGENSLKLTIPAGSLTAGIEYDYLRLELDELAAPTN